MPNPFKQMQSDPRTISLKKEMGLPTEDQIINPGSFLSAILQSTVSSSVKNDLYRIQDSYNNIVNSKDPNPGLFPRMNPETREIFYVSGYDEPGEAGTLDSWGSLRPTTVQLDSAKTADLTNILKTENKYNFVDDKYEDKLLRFLSTSDYETLNRGEGIIKDFISSFEIGK